ncbi:hypothetical protein [Actinoplanes sp. NPDC020271]|uniref:hypothetical protein n=1 Tax=Actinoplanes sp. NPDC020271 TaxID=3363896 RepID=UPI0037AEA8FB
MSQQPTPWGGATPDPTAPAGYPAPGSYPGQPAPGYPAAGYPGQPAPGQPVAGYPGQPGPGHPGRPEGGYPGQPAAAYPGQPAAGYPGQPAAAYPGQPAAGYPGQPAAAYPGQPAAAHPGQAAPVAYPAPGQPAAYPGQPGAYPAAPAADGHAAFPPPYAGQPAPGSQPAYAPEGMLPCRFCGSIPAAHVKFRGHQGMIVMMRFLSSEGPFCRDCGLGVFRHMTSRTLVQGWYGYGSFIITPFTVLMNLIRRGKVADLAPPQPNPYGTSHPPADPGPRLLERPLTWAGLVIPFALVALIIFIATSN